jgi:signal transduction histidine kinase
MTTTGILPLFITDRLQADGIFTSQKNTERWNSDVLHKTEFAVRVLVRFLRKAIFARVFGRNHNAAAMEYDDSSTEQVNLIQEARLKSLGELAAGVAHQISNPLTTIIAESQILQHDLDENHSARESVDAILEAAWRAQAVIQVLKRISGQTASRYEEVQVNETIQNALSLTGSYLESNNVDVQIRLDEHLPTLPGNSRDLTDIWINLLQLSHMAAREGKISRVDISTRADDSKWIEIQFRNNGQMFPSESLQTIFEPKAVPDPARLTHGFELLLCRELASRHHGELSIESDKHSTLFEIRFPKGQSRKDGPQINPRH